jgi:hypothetical protein
MRRLEPLNPEHLNMRLSRRRTVTALAAGLLVTSGGASGQAPPATRPDAATIVSAVLAAGHTGGWNEYLDFAGCPQADPTGQGILSLIDAASPGDVVTGSLIVLWLDEYDDCGYAPLDAWISGALSDLAQGGSFYIARVTMDLPADIRTELLQQMQSLTEDVTVPPLTRAELGSTLLLRLDAEGRRDLLEELLATPGMPEDWVASWSANVTETLGSGWVNALAASASEIDDATLRAAIGTILTNVGTPALAAADPSLAQLVEAIDDRPGLQGSVDFLEALVPASLPVWIPGTSYAVGAEALYDGLGYRARQAHTAQAGWEPPNVYALWERINAGGEWAPQVIYQTGEEATYQGTTYRAIQGHQALVGWQPPNVPALWEQVN